MFESKGLINENNQKIYAVPDAPMGIGLAFSACDREELPNNGEPRIMYVRVTNHCPGRFLVGWCILNGLVAIMGENLGNTV